MVQGRPRCQVPSSLQAGSTLLWIKETPLTEQRLRGWAPKFSVEVNGHKFIVLPLPAECRKKRVEGEEYVWTPKEILDRLREVFEPDGIFVREEIREVEGRRTVSVEGFILFDEDYYRHRVNCPFCNTSITIETFNELMWRGRCPGCKARITFAFADDLSEMVMEHFDVLSPLEPVRRGDWCLWQRDEKKVYAKKVDENLHIVFARSKLQISS